METPTHYSDVSEKALNARDEMGLTDVQTLLHDHVCRGDFYLRNDEGQKFYDKDNNGFGWSGDRDWVKRQFKPLVKAGLVKFESLRDCRSGSYTSWVWYDQARDYAELINAGCYVNTYKLAETKHFLNLPDGFDKKAGVYEGLEFYREKNLYRFRFNGEQCVDYFDRDGLKYPPLEKKVAYPKGRGFSSFHEMLHVLWSWMVPKERNHSGGEVPGYSSDRRFSV